MLLIFDLDGTLFEAKPVILNAARRLISEMGLPPPHDGEIIKYAGRGTSVFLRSIIPEEFDTAAMQKRYCRLLVEEIDVRGKLFDGVQKMLETLAEQGHTLVICSNSNEEYIKRAIEHTGISALFNGYYSAESYPSKSAVFKKIASQNITAAVIGDTGRDIEAAVEAGFFSIAALYGYGKKAPLAAATLVAKSPDEIVLCVEKLVLQLPRYRTLNGLHKLYYGNNQNRERE